MEHKFCRYNKNMLRSLGVRDLDDGAMIFTVDDAKKSCEFTDNVVIGKFRQVLELLYSHNTGFYPDFNGYLNRPDTPAIVKEFVSNVLMTELPSLPAAKDDDTALASIVSRHATASDIRYQLDETINYLKEQQQQKPNAGSSVVSPAT